MERQRRHGYFASTALAAALCFAALLAPRAAQADEPTTWRVRPTLTGGFAFALVGYDMYGFAPSFRAGVDLIAPAVPAHSLALSVGWAPFAVRGARLDYVTVEAGWRLRPFAELGFYTLANLGVAVAREAFDVTLGNARIDDVRTSVGGVGALSVGWSFFEHVDLEITYRHALLATGTAESFGTIGVSVGGRL